MCPCCFTAVCANSPNSCPRSHWLHIPNTRKPLARVRLSCFLDILIWQNYMSTMNNTQGFLYRTHVVDTKFTLTVSNFGHNMWSQSGAQHLTGNAVDPFLSLAAFHSPRAVAVRSPALPVETLCRSVVRPAERTLRGSKRSRNGANGEKQREPLFPMWKMKRRSRNQCSSVSVLSVTCVVSLGDDGFSARLFQHNNK